MGRSPCCDKSKVKRGTWSPEEDEILKNHLQNYGTGGNWISLPHKAGLRRCGKSCRLRWLNYLRPDIKHGGFTQDEEYTICNLYHTIGSRWSVIASRLPGRTDNDVKNYWNTKLKKKFMANYKSDMEKTAGAGAGATVAAAATSQIVANEPINLGSSRLILEESSDCSSGGKGNGNGNDMNFPFCPPHFQQDSSPFWSFCMDEIVSGFWCGDAVVGAEVDADLLSIFPC